jgi:DNA polymerase III subunit delta'
MTFREIVGHRRLVGLLARAIEGGSLPPSLILAGPEGVGKRQVALAVAQAVNCLNPVTDAATGWRDACGACAACGKVARGQHPDVLRVSRAEDKSEILIEQVREVIRQVGYRPFEGRQRVVMIDRAEDLNANSQNALLKVLEEPPPRNIFMLVTAVPADLLDTVRSRCCQLRFAPLAPGDIAAALIARHGYAERDARAAAAMSSGSFGRALESATGEVAEARAVAEAILIEAARAGDPRARLAIGAALLQAGGKKGKDGKGQGVERGALAVRLRALLSLLRDVMILTTRAPEQALVNLDLQGDLEPLTRHYDRDRLGRAFSAVGRALTALERHNASPKIVVDWLAFQL